MLNPLCIFVSNQSKLSRLSLCYHQTNNKALFLSGTLIHGTSVQLLWCILLRDLGILPQSLSFSVSLSASSFFHGRLIPPFVGRHSFLSAKLSKSVMALWQLGSSFLQVIYMLSEKHWIGIQALLYHHLLIQYRLL